MEGIKGILKRKKDKGNENVPEESDDNPIRSILKKPKLAKRDENPVDDKRTDQVRQPDVMKTDGEHQIHKIAPSSELQTTTDAGEAKGTLSVEKDEHSSNKKSEKETVEKEMADHKELKVDKNDSIGDVHKAQLSVKDKKSSAKEREKGSDRKSSKDKDQRQSKSHSKGSSGKSKGSKKSPSKKDGQKEKSKLVKLEEDVYEEIEPVNDPKVDRSRSCPYLDTINRSVLDFDFEKLCSVSLSHINVYACLVCGKYFQGRGKLSHAYTHSVQDSHHVYLNLQTHKFYCLPDNYEIIDSSLEDIIYVLNPTFTKDQITKMDFTSKLSRAYDKTTYLPGIVGLNNIKANDYCNVVLQALSHVSPLRDYFLQEENYKKIKRPPGDQMIMIVQRFGELLRKLWNPRNFKAHVSPHEMLQAVVLCSKKRFQITEQGDALEFLSWFLNALHAALNGSKKLNSSIINKTFRGKMKVYSHKVLPVDIGEKEKEELLQTGEYEETCEEIPWLYLTCDLPAAPLYPDEMRENIIPQVSFATILSKFNGVQEKEYKTYKDSTMKRFELTKLPPYIIVYIKRFTKNYFIQEKNRTIVNFPIKNIDFGDLLSPEVRAQHKHTVYDLMANIVHDGEPGPGKGTYRCHVLYKGANKWFEMQDLHVTDILPQMITLSESYIQIFELRRDIPNSTYNSKEAEKPVSMEI